MPVIRRNSGEEHFILENVPYYVDMMGRIAALGFDIIGGCCGTTPEHIRGLHDLLVNDVRLPKKLMPAVYSAEGKENCAEEAVEEKTDFIQKLERGEKVFVVELDPPFDVMIQTHGRGSFTPGY